MKRQFGYFCIALLSYQPLAAYATDLDLASTAPVYQTSDVPGAAGSSIIADGKSTPLGANLTAAQYVAFMQSTSPTGQQLQVNSQGIATGGAVRLDTLGTTATSIAIPHGVTALNDFAAGALNLTGNFTNSGIFYAASSSQSTAIANISALNIINGPGALLSTFAPQNILASFNLSPSANPLALNLVASQNIVNSGTITANALSMAAGGSIVNNSGAIMQSINTASLVANAITNAGLIQSVAGNININSLSAQHDLMVNNVAGILSAAGAINIRDVLTADKVNTTLWGGTLNAQELNILSGNGAAIAVMQAINSTVNVSSGTAVLQADGGSLTLGNIVTTGDPVFYNTNGNVVIRQSITSNSASPVYIVASGDILTSPDNGAISINTSGGELFMLAGANVTSNLSSQEQPPPVGTGTLNVTLTINGASQTGGSIDLKTTAPISSISTRGPGAGGEVRLLAMGGNCSTCGTIRLPENGTITTGGADASFASGNVTIIGSSRTPDQIGVTTGSVDTTGGKAGTGSVRIMSKALDDIPFLIPQGFGGGEGGGCCFGGGGDAVIPPIPPVATITVTQSGVSGTFAEGAIRQNHVYTGAITTTGGDVDIRSGGQLQINGPITTSNPLGAAGTVNLQMGFTNGGGYDLEVGTPSGFTSAFVNGGIIANGLTPSTIAINNLSGGILVNGPFSYNNPQGGGNISLSSGTSTIAIDSIDVSSATGAGGTITINSGYLQSVSGGPVQLLASGATKGGTVTVNQPNGFLSIGKTGFGDTMIDVRGTGTKADAGTVSLTAGNQLTIATDALLLSPGAGGKGATVEITVPYFGQLLITGDLDVSGNDTGAGGSIKITMPNFGSTFVIDPDNTSIAGNGIAGNFFARGGATSGDGGSFTFVGTGIIVPVGGIDVSAVEGAGGKISITASSLIDISSMDEINVSGAGSGNHDGGSLTLSSNNVAINALNPVTLSANSAGNANAGKIAISSFSKSLTVGTNPGELIISASSLGAFGDAGSLSLQSTSGKIFVDPAALSLSHGTLSGAGGKLSLVSQSNVAFAGAVDLSGSGTGAGGSFTATTSTNNFSIGRPLLPGENGVGGAINVSGSTGGSITLGARKQIQFNDVVGTLLDAHGTAGDGGKISVVGTDQCCFSYQPAAFSDAAPIVLDASGTANGGSISLQFLGGATELDTVNGGAFAILNASGANGNGGSVTVQHQTSMFPGTGQINIGNTAGPNQTLTYMIDVSGGGTKGNGGKVSTLSAGNTFNIDTAGLNYSAGSSGNGAQLEFVSDSKFLASQIVGDLDVSGKGNGNGGVIALTNYSGNIVASNLIANGSGSGSGGEIRSLTNGGLSTLTAGIISADGGTTGNGGKLTISSKLNATSVSANGGTVSGDAGSATFNNYFNALVFDPSAVSLNANNGAGGSLTLLGNGIFVTGDINLDGTGSNKGGSLTINPGFDSTTFVIGDPGNGVNGINGTVSLKGGPSGGDGGKFSLTVGNADLQFTGGRTISVDAGAQGSGGTIDISGNNITVIGTGAFQLTADGAGNGNGGKITFNAGGNTDTSIAPGSVFVGKADNEISLFARSGLAGGNGGTIKLSSGHLNLVVDDVAGLDAGPRGATGNGAIYQLSAGLPENNTNYDYYLQINGNLSANAATFGGNAGSISLAYNARINADFSLGTASAFSYLNGSLSASATSGNGGQIIIKDQYGPYPNSKTTDGVGVSITVSTSVNAGGAFNATPGVIDFNNYEVLDIDPVTGRATVRQGFISVTFAQGSNIIGKVSVEGSGVDVFSPVDGFVLNVSRIEALEGSTTITLSGANSTVSLAKGNTLVDIANIGSLSGSYYPAPVPLPTGVIASSQNLTINAANLINNGEIVAGSGFPLQRELNSLNNLTIINGTNSGDLNISGTGNLFADTINLTNITGNITANQGAVVGTVFGSSAGTFTLNSNVYGLNVNSVDAGQKIDVNANGGILTIFSSINSGSGSVSLGGFAGVIINPGATVTAGAAGLTITSLRGTDAPYSSGPLGIFIGDNATIRALGGNVALISQKFGGINIGSSVNVTADTGSLALTNNGLNPTNIGDSDFFTASGGNLDITAANSSVNIGQNDSFSSSNTFTLSATNSKVTVGDNPVITAGDNININGAAGVDLANNNTIGGLLIAGQDINITSQSDIAIGGRIIGTAGSLNTDPGQSVLQPGDVKRVGNITINSTAGTGGNISIGCCTSLTANGGSIIVTAKDSIIAPGTSWRSYGGIVGFSSGFDIDLSNGTVQSFGRLTGGAPDVFANGDSSAGYVGGAVVVQVGLSTTPGATYLSEKNLRQFANILHYQLGAGTADVNSSDPIVGYNPNEQIYPTGSISDSGRIYLVDPSVKGLAITTLQSAFGLASLEGRGGTVFIDPPPNIGVLNFGGANILAVAPPAVAGPGGPPVPPGPGGPVVPPAVPGIPVVVTVNDAPVLEVATANVPIKSSIILQTDTITEQATLPRGEPQLCAAPVQIGKSGDPDKNPAGTWAVAAATCQIFAVKEEDASILAAGGTTVASAKGGMAMKEGKMLVMTGQKTMSVYTPVGALSLPPQSCAIVEGKANGVVRVTPLAGGEATMTVREGEKIERITTAGGREIIIASNDVDDEELIPTDGVDRIAVSARVALADVDSGKQALKVRVNKFDKRELIARDPLLNCRECLGQMKKRVAEMAKGPDIIDKPRANLIKPNTVSTKDSSTASEEGHFLPVAAFKSTNALASKPTGLRTMSFDGINVHSQAARVTYDSQILNLTDGEAMIVAQKPAVVRLTNGAVAQIARGTIAIISQEGEKSFIQVLHDERSGSVNVRIAGKVIKLSCGQELVVAKEKPGNILKSNPIGRRRVQSMPASKTHHMMLSEVSIASLLMHSPVFSSLTRSTDSRDKETTDKIMKTAAALGVASGGHGQYARY